MEPILYFLRSTEQKIVTDMLYYAYRLDESDKKVQDFPHLEIYYRFYGLSSRDLGIYALNEHKITGGAWIRVLKQNDMADGFVDEKTPILTIALKPEFRGKGIGSAMLEQLFLEAGGLFEQISVSTQNSEKTINYFKKFGFIEVENSQKTSLIDGSEVITMVKQIPNERVVQPTEGYNPQKWMD